MGVMRIISLIIGVSCILLLTGCGNSSSTNEPYTTNNPKEVYKIVSDVREDMREAHTGMLIFPDRDDYYSDVYAKEEIYGFSTSHQIYNVKTYEKDEYESEVARLKEVANNGEKVYYTEDLFSLPAIVAAYSYQNRYEYALLDVDNLQIIYVCNTFLDDWSFIEESYRPNNYDDAKELEKFDYSIY